MKGLLYPHHLQLESGLLPDEFPAPENFGRCLVQQTVEHFFFSSVLFPDKARFRGESAINIHNKHQRAEKYPHGVIHSRHKQ
jgi:hypothetical protein